MRGEQLKYKESIRDLLRLLNLDSSQGYRELLAKELDIHVGSPRDPERNIALYDTMIEQLCKNGGEVPEWIRRLKVTK
jgi:hypothetical protein